MNNVVVELGKLDVIWHVRSSYDAVVASLHKTDLESVEKDQSLNDVPSRIGSLIKSGLPSLQIVAYERVSHMSGQLVINIVRSLHVSAHKTISARQGTYACWQRVR